MSFWEKLKELLAKIFALFKKNDALTKVTTTTMLAKTIKIVTRGDSCGFDPISMRVVAGDAVTFTNETENGVELFFTNREIFDEVSLLLEPGESVTLTVKEGQGGEVHISVRCNTLATHIPMTTAPTIVVNRD